MEWQYKHWRISDDPTTVDTARVIRFLHQESYWGQDITAPAIEKSLRHSLCFSLLDNTTMVGFARVITDYAVFGYLEDVFIDEAVRGQGLGVWLMQCVMAHPDVKALRKIMLATSDAHGLYEKSGFTRLSKPEMVMERYNHDNHPVGA